MTEEQVFLAALDLPDVSARNAYLGKACGEDPALREKVENLLAAHFKSGEFLNVPAAEQISVEPGGSHAVTVDSHVMSAAIDPENESEGLEFLARPTRPDSLGRIGHYEVLHVLGTGGFGIVLRAFDDMLQRVVAIKVMAPLLAATSPARKRFLREARTSAQVRHENVVQVYEVGEQPLPYLVMEFIPGETLQQRLDRVGPLDVPETLRIGRQIAEGLGAAHANDLIHRDIKPGNIMLEGGQCKVKITDFGLARAADDASMTQSGMIAGTPMYMAPEQALGQTLDQRADLFSLGSVLYQMVAGRPPFRANSTLAVLKRVADDTPRDIREIIPETPRWLCDIIAKLHAKNPHDRYQSAREVADVLADCEAQLKASSRLQDFSRIPRGKPAPSRKWKWVAAAVLLPLIALAVTEFAGATHLLWKRPTTTEPTADGVGPPTNLADDRPAVALPQERVALEFDGDADYVATPLVYDGSTPLTVEATVQISEWPVDKKEEHSEIVSSTQLGGFSVGTAKKGFYISARVGDGYVSVYSSQDDQYLNRPVRLAGIIDDKVLRLYIDGKQVGQTAFEHQFQPGTQKISLGTSPGAGTPHDGRGYEWSGKMYEVRISNIARHQSDYDASAALAADEYTLALYRFDEGAGDILNDVSGNERHGRIVGARWVNAGGSPSNSAPGTTFARGELTDADAPQIDALQADEQIEEVRKELMRLNPEFDGKLEHKIEGDVITELSFNSDEVDNIAPVRVLQGLVYLDCRGTYPNKGKLSDLSPLRGMTLSRLDCSSTQVADLAPLAGMPLTFLQFNHNPVSDLTPLKGMPLLELGCAETKVADLSPLKGMKLRVLGAQLLPVTDLSPLQGMPLTGLDLYHTIGVTSLEPLKGMPLEGLNLQDVPVSDLSPLKGMESLRTLLLQGTAVSDLTPLQGLKLTSLFVLDKQISDLSPLKGMPLVRLATYGSSVTDLRPLQGMELAEIRLTPQNVTQGLEILRDMRSLITIGISGEQAWPAAEFWDRFDKGEFKE